MELREMIRSGLSPARPARWLPVLVVALASLPGLAHAEGLNLSPDLKLVGINIVMFGLLIYPVNRLLVRPMLAVLNERERRTAGAEGDVEKLRSEAQEARRAIEAGLLEMRSRAQARRAAILGAGETDERALLDAARADSTQAFERVREAVENELSAARSALESDARALAREAAARILGRPL